MGERHLADRSEMSLQRRHGTATHRTHHQADVGHRQRHAAPVVPLNTEVKAVPDGMVVGVVFPHAVADQQQADHRSHHQQAAIETSGPLAAEDLRAIEGHPQQHHPHHSPEDVGREDEGLDE